ncbi:hypothetical protein BDV12DRAFT_13280 [Aspergillus spectabilis]
MSVSVSFGPGGAVTHFGNPGLVAADGPESAISQTMVLGVILAIFAAQMAVNVFHALRMRQQARVAGTQAAQRRRELPEVLAAADVPREVQDEVEGRNPNPPRDNTSDTNTG